VKEKKMVLSVFIK